jgi:hypothetical protein
VGGRHRPFVRGRRTLVDAYKSIFLQLVAMVSRRDHLRGREGDTIGKTQDECGAVDVAR